MRVARIIWYQSSRLITVQVAVDVVGWIIRSVSRRGCWRRLLAFVRGEVASSIKEEEGRRPRLGGAGESQGRRKKKSAARTGLSGLHPEYPACSRSGEARCWRRRPREEDLQRTESRSGTYSFFFHRARTPRRWVVWILFVLDDWIVNKQHHVVQIRSFPAGSVCLFPRT